ncbi:ribonuclease HII [Patescibacteria group bacterium]|nr:ribonuclease HII [Patescibacteria group bacterium]MBU4057811.1 ribonuclease HII [Patescibacteria group bacterium]MBU4115918.1 ribonuclease HII [Patescibacteria group bacterium]
MKTKEKIRYLIGIDEVGRGPLAGPVCVCSFVISKDNERRLAPVPQSYALATGQAQIKNRRWTPVPQSYALATGQAQNTTKSFDMRTFAGVKDSKKLSAKKREEWFEKIKNLKKKEEVDYKIAYISNSEIDKIGISKSIKKAIKKCLKDINPKTCKVLLDGGLKAPKEFLNQKTIIKGDEKKKIISLASIIAKVSRDKKMCGYSKKYPEYEFHKHKGYGTTLHIKKIKKHGSCKIHRKTYIKNI